MLLESITFWRQDLGVAPPNEFFLAGQVSYPKDFNVQLLQSPGAGYNFKLQQKINTFRSRSIMKCYPGSPQSSLRGSPWVAHLRRPAPLLFPLTFDSLPLLPPLPRPCRELQSGHALLLLRAVRQGFQLPRSLRYAHSDPSRKGQRSVKDRHSLDQKSAGTPVYDMRHCLPLRARPIS